MTYSTTKKKLKLFVSKLNYIYVYQAAEWLLISLVLLRLDVILQVFEQYCQLLLLAI